MKRQQRLFIILAVAVVLLLGAFFYGIIYPQYTSLSDKADVATAAKNKATSDLAAAEKLNPDKINARLANLQARVPSTLELPNAINRIDEIAVANNLIWLEGSPEDATVANTAAAAPAAAAAAPATGQTATVAPQLDRHEFTIVVQGAIPDVVKFMAGLTDKSIGRIVIINSLDLQFKSTDDANVVNATIKLQVIGWKEGSNIDSSGCLKADGLSNSAQGTDNPDCNQTTVSGSSK